jgi:hypothetical protein
MSVAAILERVSASAKRRAESDDQAYLQLVLRCGRGEEVDPDKVLVSLNKWGRDIHQFQEDVEKHTDRLDLDRLAATGPELQEELSAVQVRIEEANTEYARVVSAAETERETALLPLENRERELTRKIAAASDARAKLIRECTDPVRHEAVRVAQVKRNAAQERLDRLRQERIDLPTALRIAESDLREEQMSWSSEASHPDEAHRNAFVPGHMAAVATAENRVASLKADIETAPSRIAAVQAEVDQAQAEYNEATESLSQP